MLCLTALHKAGDRMNTALIQMFMPHTAEEERLLCGEPLKKDTYTDRGAFVVEGKKFFTPRQMISLRQHTRFVNFPEHRHDYVEMMYVLSGEVVHDMPDGLAIHLRAGEVLLINRHAAHGIRRCGEEDIAVNFIIQPAFFEIVPELIGMHNVLGHFLLDALRDDEKAVSYLHFRIADNAAIQLLMHSIIYSLVQEKPAGMLVRRTEMALLFLHLLSQPECMQLPGDTQRENLYVIEMLQEIRVRFNSFALKDFAQQKHVSSAYLSRVLKEATGKTCTELLQERRIEKAKRLLQETDLSVLEICSAVGYNNSSYFYRIFEAAEGVSPTAYRVNSGCSEK